MDVKNILNHQSAKSYVGEKHLHAPLNYKCHQDAYNKIDTVGLHQSKIYLRTRLKVFCLIFLSIIISIPPKCHHEKRDEHRCHYGECPPCRQICNLPLPNCEHYCTEKCHTAVAVMEKMTALQVSFAIMLVNHFCT